MARLTQLSLLGLSFAGAISALPEAFNKRDSCSHNNCLRAVIANNAKPGPSSASADCISFFQKTVTPCESTATAWSTVLVTAVPDTVTVDATETVTAGYVTDVSDVFVTQTAATQDVPTTISTVSLQDTVTVVVPTVTTSTSTAWQTITQANYNFAGPSAKPSKRAVDTIDEVCPVTAVPTAVPTYASACSGTVKYSSACSCVGITESTITVEASTTTTTALTTVTITPAAVTAVQTLDVPVTPTVSVTDTHTVDVTVTHAVPVVATTVLDPATVFSTSTSTSVVTVTSTTTVAGPTQYCNVQFQAKGGNVDGRYITFYNTYQNIASSGVTSGQTYTIGSNGKVHPVGGFYNGQTLDNRGTSNYYVYVDSDTTISNLHYNALVCSVAQPSLQVTCTPYASSKTFTFYEGPSNSAGKYLYMTTSTLSSTPFSLNAVPVNCA